MQFDISKLNQEAQKYQKSSGFLSFLPSQDQQSDFTAGAVYKEEEDDDRKWLEEDGVV